MRLDVWRHTAHPLRQVASTCRSSLSQVYSSEHISTHTCAPSCRTESQIYRIERRENQADRLLMLQPETLAEADVPRLHALKISFLVIHIIAIFKNQTVFSRDDSRDRGRLA